MRLICPKCDAQYNIADDAIPAGGRDVQCSTCGHTWFQTEMSRVLSRPVSRVLSRPIPMAVKSEPVEPQKQNSRDVAAFDVPHQHAKADAGPMDGPRHRPVDDNIANILRQEAGREHNVPAPTKNAAPPKTQAEKKPAAPVDIEETRKRIAQMTETEGGTRQGESPAAAAAAAIAASANPRAIPELGEINAVLRAREENRDADGLTEAEIIEAQRRQGFRRGFFFVAGVFALIITPYVLSDQIIENLPQSRETMMQYVAVIDELRGSLNAFVGGIGDSIRAITS